jgi:hypothetical protein
VRWCVIRHPNLPGSASVVAEDALTVWQPRGWVRVSDWETDHTLLRPADCADAPDLDAEPAVDKTEAEPKAPAKTSSKEKS